MTEEEDCVRQYPKNALEAWRSVIPWENDTTDFLQDWKQQKAWEGLRHGVRNKVNGELENVPQPQSIRERYTVDNFANEIKSSDDAERRACVTAFDKNRNPLDVRNKSTQCAKGLTCMTVDDDGFYMDTKDKAERTSKKTSKGQVSVGYCLPKGHTRVSNFKNRHTYDARLQQANDEIDRLKAELNTLKHVQTKKCKARNMDK